MYRAINLDKQTIKSIFKHELNIGINLEQNNDRLILVIDEPSYIKINNTIASENKLKDLELGTIYNGKLTLYKEYINGNRKNLEISDKMFESGVIIDRALNLLNEYKGIKTENKVIRTEKSAKPKRIISLSDFY